MWHNKNVQTIGWLTRYFTYCFAPAPIKLQPEKATSIEDQAVLPENRGFTFLELKTITNNFERVLGKGGFGIVYYGRLRDGTEVAVKLRAHTVAQESMFSESQIEESDSKAQRIKEFQAEVCSSKLF